MVEGNNRFNIDLLISKLEEQLPKIRWWPWRAPRKIMLEYYSSIDDAIFLLFSSNGSLFYLPLVVTGSKPDLPVERIIEINNEYLYEAEFSNRYIDLLRSSNDILIEEHASLKGRSIKAEPLSLESTNVLAKHHLDTNAVVVVKSYRLLSRVNMEPLMLRKLTLEEYRNIPKLYLLAKFKDEIVSIILEYVEGIGDGGYPFYLACREYFKGNRVKGMKLGLAGKLGTIIADLHLKLNKPGDKGFFGVETISDRDVESWNNRIVKRYNDIMMIIDNILSETDKKREYMKLDYWRQLLDKKAPEIIDHATHYMEFFIDKNKARIHQDLHLAQMIYIEDREDFIITDFEGEPGRGDDERIIKEPPLRDIASMIRSFQYLSFMTYMEVRGHDIHNAAKHLVKNDATWNWRMRHSLSMVLSYISSTSNTHLHGIDKIELMQRYNEYLLPWIIERALYEIYYEAMYRPEWIPVPIIGFINPSIPAYKQV